ncbi:oligogalacturonate lyase family protein [Croceivirga radicis]|nr:oligogalacturonate lyase family protein [Croceivirga radicis]
MKTNIIYRLVLITMLWCFAGLSAQTINGINYNTLNHVSKTFDLAGADSFGQTFASESFTYKDKVTGKTIIALTTSKHHNSKMYQTHPQWTADGKYIIFTSNRTATKEDKTRQYYAISTKTHKITQITTGNSYHDFHLSWKSNQAYRFKKNKLISIDLDNLLEDSSMEDVKSPEAYEKIIATIPDTLKPTGMGLDATENKIYFASKLADKLYGIYQLDFKTGVTKQLLEVPFWVGHLQANPYKANSFLYCWETRGDAPQRMWYVTVQPDGKVTNKALYRERADDWVTHEVFMGANQVLFHLMGHLDRLNANKTGIFSINTETNKITFHGQTTDGGYWHCNATPDGKYILGDTFDGKLYRINTKNPEEQLLLTQGHRKTSVSPFSSEAHMHQSISPDGKWVLFNSSRFTACDILVMEIEQN